uniref:Uncharacterized protein n=1 Tax=Anguilla anguilla TaxID=7936 RepID=A0A0E9SLV5_ANGAN
MFQFISLGTICLKGTKVIIMSLMLDSLTKTTRSGTKPNGGIY